MRIKGFRNPYYNKAPYEVMTMESGAKKVLYIIGIIIAVYIALRYILPLILSMVGFVISTLFTVLIWGIIGLAVIFIIVYIFKSVKK